jgi:hypothetical protein
MRDALHVSQRQDVPVELSVQTQTEKMRQHSRLGTRDDLAAKGGDVCKTIVGTNVSRQPAVGKA